VTTLAQNHSYCRTGEYQMQHDPGAMMGGNGGELVPERMTYGSCTPGSVVDYSLPASFANDADCNLRFQLEVR